MECEELKVELCPEWQGDIDAAVDRADAAAGRADLAADAANVAANLANTAADRANESADKADEATKAAEEATKNAETATDNAKTATSDAEAATQKANDAADTANNAASRVETAISDAESATAEAKTATNAANNAADKANKASDDLQAKVDAGDFDGATFTPSLKPVEGGNELSWTNDKGRVNPDPVTILDGKDANIDDTVYTKDNALSAEATLERFGCHENLIGERVEFSAIKDTPIKVLAHITAQQNGSGVPSPTNPRDIYGWNEITIQHGNTVEDESKHQVFDSYVFGGTFNTDGELFITHDMKTFNGSENWVKKSLPNGRVDYIYMLKDPTITASSDTSTQLCNIFNTQPTEGMSFNYNGVWVIGDTVYVGTPIASKYADVSNWKAFLQSNNMQLLYEREIMDGKKYPPVIIKAFEGNNFIQSSTGVSDVDCYSKVCPADLQEVKDTADLALDLATNNASRLDELTPRVDGLETNLTSVKATADYALELAKNQPTNHAQGTLVHVEDAYATQPLKLVTQGKTSVNLFPKIKSETVASVKFTCNSDTSISVKGTPIYSYTSDEVKLANIKPNTQYSLSAKGLVGRGNDTPGGVYLYVEIKGESSTVTKGVYEDDEITFTTPDKINSSKVLIALGADKTTERNTTIYPMLVEGSKPQSWTPSGITCVNELKVEQTSKNLCPTKIQNVTEQKRVGQYYGEIPGAFKNFPGLKEFIYSADAKSNVEPFKTVCWVIKKDGHATTIAATNVVNRSGRVQLKVSGDFSDVEEFHFRAVAYNEPTDFTWSVSNQQIELGSQATPYEPYNGNTTVIDLQGHEACDIPDGQGDHGAHDVVDYSNNIGNLIKNTQTVTVTSNDMWTAEGTTTSGAYRYRTRFEPPLPEMKGYFGRAYPLAFKRGYDGVSGTCYITTGEIIAFSNKPTVEEFKQEIGEQGITIITDRVEPQHIPLAPADIPTLPSNVANVWVETNVPDVTTELDYIQDINVVLSDIRQAIVALPAQI